MGAFPGSRTQKSKNVIRGSKTTGPSGNGGGGPVEHGLRMPKRGNDVKGSKS
jgi:hypothetical protein